MTHRIAVAEGDLLVARFTSESEAASVGVRALSAVGDEEAFIDSEGEPGQGDADFDGEVEDVEAGLGEVPRGLGVRGSARGEVESRGAPAGAEVEEDGGDEDEEDLGAHGARAELVDGATVGVEVAAGDGGEDDRDGEEGDDGVEGFAVELDVADGVEGGFGEGVEGEDDADDEADDAAYDDEEEDR